MSDDEWDDPPLADDAADGRRDSNVGSGLALVGTIMVFAAVGFYVEGHPTLAFGMLTALSAMAAVIGSVDLYARARQQP